jgi:hypothetical protein
MSPGEHEEPQSAGTHAPPELVEEPDVVDELELPLPDWQLQVPAAVSSLQTPTVDGSSTKQSAEHSVASQRERHVPLLHPSKM